MMPLRKEIPFPQVNFGSFNNNTTTLLSGEGGEGRTSTATMFRKCSHSIQFSQQFYPRLSFLNNLLIFCLTLISFDQTLHCDSL